MKKLLLLFSTFYLFSNINAQGFGCPSVEASPDVVLACNATNVDISADVFHVGLTDSYAVNPIPHSPPIAYNAPGGTGVSVNTDDVWSNVIPIPFPFCYFGQTYNSCVIGSNGGISFNTSNAGGYHPWPFSASAPSTSLTNAGDIFGPYHDIDPSEGGNINWYVLGQAPCRTFIVSYNNIPHYDCTSKRSTSMMVLYETTNIIEMYINNKSTCGGWNDGNTLLGIQNPAGTTAYTPPNRNTGNWGVSTAEAWQFKPDGAPIYGAIEWFDGATLVGTGSTINVSPTPPQTTYTAQVTYTRCDGLEIVETDEVVVDYDAVTVDVNPSSSFNCSGAVTTLTATSPTATDFTWQPGGLTGATVDVSPLTTTTYTVTAANSANGCTDTASATITVAQPTSTSCNVLYVSPTGTPNAVGTKADPMDLATALEAGACNGTIVKMAVGDYITDTVINRVTSYITLEGGFDPGLNWDKISTTGATRILRTATQTHSLTSSTLVTNGTGIVNETGANPEVVAISLSNQTGFRFQDLTIETELNNPSSQHAGYEGVDVVGVRLNSCNDYNIVRTQIIADQASNGANEILSITATNGGNSTGLELITNGANGNVIQSNITAGAGGIGGTPGGTNGNSNNISPSGTALNINESSFDLANQATIQMNDIACTASEIFFNGTSSDTWTFGAGSTPNTDNGTTVSSIYNSLGRKDINYASDNYVGFNNIISDSQELPDFTINAPVVMGEHRVCVEDSFSLTINNGGIGYQYHWEIIDETINDTILFTTTDINTGNLPTTNPGRFSIGLRFETNCCGLSAQTVQYLYVEDRPTPIMPADENICIGDFGAVTLSVGGMLNGGSISWSPSSGLSANDTSTVLALPSTTQTYTVVLEDSTGLCSNTDNVTVNVVDLQLNASSTDADCVTPGTATVTVSGGSGDYAYEWSNGDNGVTATNLQPGTYEVLVLDNILGCTDSTQVVVSPAAGAFEGQISDIDILCAGTNSGQITVVVNGGTGPYTYTWQHIGTTTTTANNIITLDNLNIGTFTINVQDATGCNYDATTEITEVSPMTIVVDSVEKPTCLGIDDAYTEIRVSGGERPYSYSWSDGTIVTIVNDAVLQTNLSSGEHTLFVTDDNGCMDSVTVSLYANIINNDIDTTVCIGTVYSLLDGSDIIVNADTSVVDTFTSPAGCETILTTNIIAAAGNTGIVDTVICNGESITVNGTIYDSNTIGAIELITNNNPLVCDSIVTVNVEVLPPPSISVTANPDSIILGDTSTLEAIGNGIFEWDNVQTGSTYQVTPQVNSSYTVTLIDTNGCENEASITVYLIDTAQFFVVFPNAFTPNNDGLNDNFRVVSNQEFTEVDMSVYNRWGERIYVEVGNQNTGWDGTFNGEEQAVDSYTYSVKITTLENEVLIYTGTVALIR